MPVADVFLISKDVLDNLLGWLSYNLILWMEPAVNIFIYIIRGVVITVCIALPKHDDGYHESLVSFVQILV